LLLSAFPGVPVLSCVPVGPAAVDVSVILVETKISGFAAIFTAVNFPSAVDVPSTVDVSFDVDVPSAVTVINISGVPAVACVPTLVNIPFLPVLATLLLLASPYIPAFFNIAVVPALLLL
jgi:hypothetical protein